MLRSKKKRRSDGSAVRPHVSLSLVSNLLTADGRSREGATLIRAAEFEDVDEDGDLAAALDLGRDELNSQIMCLGAT